MSSNNWIYHNNFIDNREQVIVLENSKNTWHAGYPKGGNYWSDHVNDDQYSGPSQDQPGSDGICDTPYIMDDENIDKYPLVNPFGKQAGEKTKTTWSSTPTQQTITENKTTIQINTQTSETNTPYSPASTSTIQTHDIGLNDLNPLIITAAIIIVIVITVSIVFITKK